MGTCRLVIEPEPASGVRNMALDEALLEAAIDRGECTVRWYRWNEATVSLGYFQNLAAMSALPDLAALPVVRRLSGGGAILHHQEWTYSCAIPAAHRLAAQPVKLYALVHEQLIAALREQGIETALRGGASAKEDALFLCFGRGDPRDVVLGAHKIVGSAQRRRRGNVLQHGSVLMRRSEYAPEFPGLLDLASGPFDSDAFVRSAAPRVAALFGAAEVAGHTREIEDRSGELARLYADASFDLAQHHRPDAAGAV